MNWKMRRLMERGGIHFKDDPENPGGGSDNGDAEAAAKAATEAAAAAKVVADAEEAAVAAAAKEAGEGDKPDLEIRKLVKETMQRKEALRKERATNDALTASNAKTQGELDVLKAALGDVDLEDVKTLLKGRVDAETKALEEQGEYKRILEQVKEQNATKEEGFTTEITTLNGTVKTLLAQIDEMTVGRSFSESKYIQDRSTLPASIARREFSQHFELKDGVLVAYDKPASAENRTPLVDAEGGFKPFEKAIEFLYDNHADSKSLIKSVMKPGSKSSTIETPGDKTDNSDVKRTGLAKIQTGLASLKK
jgi:hypothetical protein